MQTTDPLAYYAQPGVMTDPGPYAYLFDSLPSDIAALCAVANGSMAHTFWADIGKLQPSAERRQERTCVAFSRSSVGSWSSIAGR
jgi:hypothetical protein